MKLDRDQLALGGWIAALVAAIVAFGVLGDGALATPALTDLGAWPDWFAAGDAATTSFALLRLLVLALAWYLVGVTTIGIVARVARARRLTAIADALTVPAVRRLLQAALGLGLATGAVSLATAAPPVVVPIVAAPDAMAAAADLTALAQDDDGPISDPLVPESATVTVPGRGGVLPPALDPRSLDAPHPTEGASVEAAADPVGDERPDPASADGRIEPDPAAPSAWVVASGDHFWSIAERHLADAFGHAPSDADVVPYWRALIDANRGVLAVPGNPDLLYPGQVLTLPDIGDVDDVDTGDAA